jgi:hypothetical protein
MSEYVEDLFETIAEEVLSGNQNCFGGHFSDKWSQSFITSVYSQIERGSSISTEQAKIILRMISQAETYLIENGFATQEKLSDMMIWPKYRKEPYQSKKIPKEVRHIGSNILAFRFKRIKEIMDDLNYISSKSFFAQPFYDHNFNLWLVPVIRSNLPLVINLIRKHNFYSDEATDRWLKLARESRDMPSTFKIEDNIVVAKVYDNPIMALWMENVLAAEPI